MPDHSCSSLTDDEHLIYSLCCSNVNRNGTSKETRETLLKATDLDWRTVTEHLKGLQQIELIEFNEYGRIEIRGNALCRHRLGRASVRACAKSSKPQVSSTKLEDGESQTPTASSTTARRGRSKKRLLSTEGGEGWTGVDLASYFSIQLYAVFSWEMDLGPDPVNFKALGKNVSRWIHQDGISPATVKKMIEIFCIDNASYKLPGKPQWLSFVNKRQALYEKATGNLRQLKVMNMTNEEFEAAVL